MTAIPAEMPAVGIADDGDGMPGDDGGVARTAAARPRLAVVRAAPRPAGFGQPGDSRRAARRPAASRLAARPLAARPPVCSAARPAGTTSARPSAPPLRLTRRGRVVVAVASVLAAAAVTSLLSLAAAGGALASSRGQARAGYAGLHQVVVEPGQTLWSIASAAEPAADPRAVIPQIMQVNSLTGAPIRAGQVLWVP